MLKEHTYRLFSNKKFDQAEVYFSHYQSTKERIKGKKLVFAVQDTSYLDFDSHLKTKGLGSISKAYTKHKMVLMLHSTLILLIEGQGYLLSNVGLVLCVKKPPKKKGANIHPLLRIKKVING